MRTSQPHWLLPSRPVFATLRNEAMKPSDMTTRLGDELYEALINREAVAPLSERYPELTIDDAYRIQLHMIDRRLALGERVVGKKIGLTSAAVQTMLGVSEPDFGHLTSGMAFS